MIIPLVKYGDNKIVQFSVISSYSFNLHVSIHEKCYLYILHIIMFGDKDFISLTFPYHFGLYM